MKVVVDPDLCIECGACIDTCPEVFDWNDEGKAEAKLMRCRPNWKQPVRKRSKNALLRRLK